jgi:hypothetical protein
MVNEERAVLPGRWRWFSTLNADLDGYIPQHVAGFDHAAMGLNSGGSGLLDTAQPVQWMTIRSARRQGRRVCLHRQARCAMPFGFWMTLVIRSRVAVSTI